jgi:two-component system phosphate regulon sensor histidine kinase PhoR
MMRKKIFKNMMLMTAITLLVAAVGILFGSYRFFSNQFEQQVDREGKIISDALNEMNEQQRMDFLNSFSTDEPLRITLIEKDGTVLFDNMYSSNTLENHLQRPEVQKALQNQIGKDIRFSQTYGGYTYYFAVMLKQGQILRVAFITSDIVKLFANIIPIVCVCLVVSLIVGFLLARRMTQKIIKPINNMDFQKPTMNGTYEELRPLVQRIKRQNEERSKNEKMRQEFSANVSHELKTPLTSISGYAELLESGLVQGDDVMNFAQKIHKEATRMSNLVNDIIKISKLDEHRVGIEKESVDLLKVVLDVKDRLELVAEKQKVTVRVSGQQVIVTAVEQLIDEMVYNLCENAIKYNKTGGTVYINVGMESGRARLEISDTGIGIPKDCQDRVFERFFRVDKSHSRQTGGTGLGLAIVKHVVEYHNGSISLSSTPNQGTTIVVTL